MLPGRGGRGDGEPMKTCWDYARSHENRRMKGRFKFSMRRLLESRAGISNEVTGSTVVYD